MNEGIDLDALKREAAAEFQKKLTADSVEGFKQQVKDRLALISKNNAAIIALNEQNAKIRKEIAGLSLVISEEISF